MTQDDTTLADRIEQAGKRSADLAASVADAGKRAREFVHEHPVASVAGGILIGALVAGALTRRKQVERAVDDTAQDAAQISKATAARIARLASIGAEMALQFATRAAAASREGAARMEETLNHSGAEAGHKLNGLAEAAITTLRDASQTVVNRLKQH
ncbi:hypothetical protein [Novosphingobium sp.]|uniref:hypothetical protein n=1 Tax=Novosphingobium sp. TaxID=1874826 RepID=UPI003342BD1B